MAATNERIVICGAGIAGVAAAYHLAVVNGCNNVVLVEAESPLSMTSDKSTEAYRNWWPGPDWAMTAYMNRSIDLLEEIARTSDNRINLNRRGYLFASADTSKAAWLSEMASMAERSGAGPVRTHEAASRSYVPSPVSGFEMPLTGADIITDAALIREHFPYLAPETCVVAHARRAGWLSAQQLGMVMLERARAAGVQMIKGRVSGVETTRNRVSKVHVEQADGLQSLDATHLVLAAGPLMKVIASELGITLPIYAERHQKISLSDTLGVVPRSAPMLIWLDEQRLPWSAEERAELDADASTRWLTQTFPAGVHGRPDGSGTGTTLLVLFNYENKESDVVFPLPEDGTYAEIALRGISTMVPQLKAYIDKGAKPYIDGGYYMKTKENRPLIGPTPIEGVYISGAYSGFGIMASCAGGELLAAHVLGKTLPDYAPYFMLSRYRDTDYLALLDRWGDGGQL